MSASYRVWAVESGVLQWEGVAPSPAAAIRELATDVGCELGDLPATLVEELGSDHDLVWSPTSEAWVPAPRWWPTRTAHD